MMEDDDFFDSLKETKERSRSALVRTLTTMLTSSSSDTNEELWERLSRIHPTLLPGYVRWTERDSIEGYECTEEYTSDMRAYVTDWDVVKNAASDLGVWGLRSSMKLCNLEIRFRELTEKYSESV